MHSFERWWKSLVRGRRSSLQELGSKRQACGRKLLETMAEARTQKLRNPFYIALLFVGGIFGITACAYVVMMLAMANPRAGDPDQSVFIYAMNRYGTTILLVELGMLGVLTLGSIATDDYWTGDEAPKSQPASPEAPSKTAGPQTDDEK